MTDQRAVNQIRAFVFDWGDTVMRDFDLPGPMSAWDRVEWVPGAEEALAWLSERYCCIIATSASHSDVPEMRKALSRVGADRYFRHFFRVSRLVSTSPMCNFFSVCLRCPAFSRMNV